MRVLVTGASGFIGSAVATTLKSRQHTVIGIGRSEDCPANCDQWLTLNLLANENLNAIESAKADCLIHCAWDATPGTYWTTPKNLEWVAASLKLIEAFRSGGGRRVVIAGTSAEYRWDGEATLSEADSPLEPDSLYGTCKNSLRQIVESWAKTNDISWAWGRVFCPFGKHEKPQRLIPKLIRRLKEEETLPFDSGSLIRDFLSVEDLADAFVTLAQSDVQGAINLASGRDTSIRELLIAVADHLGTADKIQFDVQPDPEGQPRRIVACVKRLNNELNWQPKTTLSKSIANASDWWR